MKDWIDDARCAEIDGDLFFPLSYISPAGQAQIEDAKEVCAGCSVLRACRADALDREGSIPAERRNGVVAGLTPKERYQLSLRSTRARETAAA